ncbi:MAG: hypothetical protein LBF77_07900 [Spirochaetaceae bacterium]|jgi:hypothetical protein|nr:hypothetical protein [Spirochaetaceae bacterium]
MNRRINFEDNIFILNTRIKVIRDMLLLDADPDFFLKKTLDDLEFIDSTLSVLLDSLNNNKKYVEREEQFYNLLETERSLSEVLKTITSGDGTVSVDKFPEIEDRITLIRNRSLSRRKVIEGVPFEAAATTPREPWVSRDELSELLKGMA